MPVVSPQIDLFEKPPLYTQLGMVSRARLVQRRDLTEEEANIIFTCWYPLTKTEEEEALEEQEDQEAFDLEDSNQENDDDDEEIRPEAEDNERE